MGDGTTVLEARMRRIISLYRMRFGAIQGSGSHFYNNLLSLELT
jgi:hypothetical protein